MAKVRVVTLDRAQSPMPENAANSGIESRAYLGKPGDPLHLIRHALSPFAALHVAGDLNDRQFYIEAGEVSIGDQVLVAGSSMIVEFGATALIKASGQGAVILDFHQSQRPADARPGGHVHLLPRQNLQTTVDLGTQNEMGGGLHADASCPTCTVWLHENDFHCQSGTIVPPHSHSEDEIIYVTAGEIQLGQRLYGPGTALAVAADTIYAFNVPSAGLSFINFRAASPTVTTPRGVMDEAEMWFARLGRPNYVEVSAPAPDRRT